MDQHNTQQEAKFDTYIKTVTYIKIYTYDEFLDALVKHSNADYDIENIFRGPTFVEADTEKTARDLYDKLVAIRSKAEDYDTWIDLVSRTNNLAIWLGERANRGSNRA